MKYLRFARHWIWLAPLALGVAFIAAGGYMVLEGRNAHNDVRDSIAQENITVSADAPAFGGVNYSAASGHPVLRCPVFGAARCRWHPVPDT